jgi:ATPase subunit of ABC transporter with duplicated ATPase domains
MSSVKKLPSMLALLGEVLRYKYFEDVLRVDMQGDAAGQRAFVITGPNASGKSFVSKLIAAYVRKEHKLECMNVGMAFRTTPGIGRALVFSDDGDHSTGLNSYGAIEGGLRTCRQRETPHILILDEPDIGLSEGFQGAVGMRLAEFASNLPEHTVGFGVVTHSRRLLRHLEPLRPHHLRCDDKLTLKQVVENDPDDLTPSDIETARATGLKRWRAINKLIGD